MTDSPWYWFVQLEDFKGNAIAGTSEAIPRHHFPAHCQPRAIAEAYAEAKRRQHPEAVRYVLSWNH